MRFEFTHTHIYAGGNALVSGEHEAPAFADCVVEFSDGIAVPGRYAHSGEAIILYVPSYQTARGTGIAAKQWLLQPDGSSGRWRVKKRLPDGAGPER